MHTLKRLFLLLVAAVVLLVGYWWYANRTTGPEIPPITEETTAPATGGAAQTTTGPTEPTAVTQSAYLLNGNYPSYEELFRQDREYAQAHSQFNRAETERQQRCWVVMDGNIGTEYELLQEWTDQGAILFVSSPARNIREQIPAEGLQGYWLLACDGSYAYFGEKEYRDSNMYFQILRLDLKTNRIETVLQEEAILDVYFCGGAVMYYAACQGSTVRICRMYLPDQKVDVLYSLDTVPVMFRMERPASTLGDITWTTVAPEMLPLIEAELNNPNSSYREPYVEFWKAEAPLRDPAWRDGIRSLANRIRVSTDTPAIEIWTYRCTDGTVTVEKQPESALNRSEAPELLMGPWQPLPGMDLQGVPDAESKPGEDARSVIRGDGFWPGNPWSYWEEQLKKLSDEFVVETADAEDAVYCLTEDNRILQLSWDGSVCNVLYVGADTRLRNLLCRQGFLYVLEGSRILEIDIAGLQYRSLIGQADICEMYLVGVNRDGLYFRKDGCWANIYWFASEWLEETTA